MNRRCVIFACLLVAGLGLPSAAYADVLFPTVVFVYPPMLVMLIPVVVLEAFVFVAVLRANWPHAIRVSAAANALSTLVGVPAAGALSAFVPPFAVVYDINDSWLSITLLVLVFFLLSWWIEFIVARKFMPEASAGAVRRATLLGNVASYVLLIVVTGVVVAVWA